MRPVEVALVGCGGIAQKGYLPALALVPEMRCLWLVDVQKGLAQTLARRWKIPVASDNYGSILENVEAVILAVPNHLHAPMALEALGRQKAVLCEKPLGRSVAEVRSMVEAAQRAGVPLVAGMTFRQYPSLQEIRRAFPWELLARIEEVRGSYGRALDWPLTSSYLFDLEKAGGGVLIDEGVHLVDALFWLLALQGASVVDYADDGENGVEAEAEVRLTLRLPDGKGEVPGLLEVSHIRNLANRIEVVAEGASFSIPLSSTDTPQLHQGNSLRPALDHPIVPRGRTHCFAEQLKAFARRVRGLEADCADGESQVPVLELIESCYAKRRPLTFSWDLYGPWVNG